MGNLLAVVGVMYAVAILVQMLSYQQCTKKAAKSAKAGLDADGVVAAQPCY